MLRGKEKERYRREKDEYINRLNDRERVKEIERERGRGGKER